MFAFILLAFLAAAYGRDSRIIGGSDAAEGQFPYQVSLKLYGRHICGGSVIAANWVITAAHCVGSYPYFYEVVVNDHDIRNETGNEIKLQVSRIIKHEDYGIGPGAIHNDIALLQVNGEIPFKHIIELVSYGEDFAGELCVISGWGYTTLGNTTQKPAGILQYTSGRILTNAECGNKWGTNINDGHVCIENQHSGACNGDSGGPLVCRNKLVGLTSWALRGCYTHYPSVYTRISYFRGWIRNIIGFK